MSGAYHNHFAEELFVYEYEGLVRKSFVDSESARAYFARDDRRVKSIFLRSHARLGELLRARGASPWDPFLEVEDVADEDALDAIDSFPRNVRIPLREQATSRESIVLTLRAPLSTKDLIAEASSLLPHDDAEATGLFEPPPICAYRFGTLFGLFLGSTVESRTEPATRLRTRFERVLATLFPELEPRLSDAPKIAALGLTGARPLRPTTKRPELLFNPWGPLYDHLARESTDLGSVRVILAFAPQTPDPTRERLSPDFLDWLRSRAREAASSQR